MSVMREENGKNDNTVTEKGARQTFSMLTVIALLIVCLASGAFSGWWFAQKYSKQIVVIDVEQIVQKRKDEFTAKYKDTDTANTATKQEMTTDITQFAKKLEGILEEEGRDRLILTKGAVVSNATDITAIVEKRIWGQ